MLNGLEYIMPNAQRICPVDLILLRRMVEQYGADAVKAGIDSIQHEIEQSQRKEWHHPKTTGGQR